MRATAVIGAGFGDEGKGHVVDFLSGNLTMVVRFNGGAQAGHTVVTPSGRRHVFHHFGSGSLQGASTYLSQFFVVNPLLWDDERPHVVTPAYGFTTNHKAPLTTPYDMLVNQEAERVRGDHRHGSCGAGINETITRNEHKELRTTAMDMLDRAGLRDKLDLIRRSYAIARLVTLTKQPPSDKFLERVNSEGILEAYMLAVERYCLYSSFTNVMPRAAHTIFEGAQGLLLDEQHHYFPHVTRGRTGLPNVITLCKEAGINSLEVIYVTRPYMTRHGAGPFRTEDKDFYIRDATNCPNEYQGSLRFGDLDQPLLTEAINRDIQHTDNFGVHIAPGLAITCLDQVSERRRLAAYELSEQLFMPVKIGSWGPSRRDIGREHDWPMAVRRGGWGHASQ